MLEKGKIGAGQFMKLVILFNMGSSILLTPNILTSVAKQDAWIASILGMGIGLLLVWIYNILGSQFPQMTLVEYSQKILGKWAGKAVSLMFFIFTFTLSALVLRNIGDFMESAVFPETPIKAIHIIFLLILTIGVRYGLENIARTSEILFPWAIILFIIFVFLLSPQVKIENLEPILSKGIKPVLQATVTYIGFPFLELILFLMIFPYVNRKEEARKAFFIGTFIGSTVLTILTTLAILTLGSEEAASNLYASFEMAKKIDIAEIIQRVESIIAVIWFITIYFKLSVCFYVSVLCFAQTFEFNNYRVLTLPMGMILVIYSIIITPNVGYLISFNEKIWTPFALTYGLFLPLFLLGVNLLKKRFSRSSKL
jgi:spore germination protein KB